MGGITGRRMARKAGTSVHSKTDPEAGNENRAQRMVPRALAAVFHTTVIIWCPDRGTP
jgi:hypothetical protein